MIREQSETPLSLFLTASEPHCPPRSGLNRARAVRTMASKSGRSDAAKDAKCQGEPADAGRGTMGKGFAPGTQLGGVAA